jgi:hypothetical protein
MWAAIAGHHSVIVIVVVGEDVERVVVASVALVHKRHVSGDIRCHVIFDVVATLGGGAFTTLGLGAATLGAGRKQYAPSAPLVFVVRPRWLLNPE